MIAHDVARCTQEIRKEHTLPSGSILYGMASQDITRRGLSYASKFGSASDPRHFTSRGDFLASRHEPKACANSTFDWFGR